MKMRDIINLLEYHSTSKTIYHGSNQVFDKFDVSANRTAKHIYTSPDPRTASFYGRIIYEIEILGNPKIADLTNDHGLMMEIVNEYWSEFEDHVRYSDEIVSMENELGEDDPSVEAAIETEAKQLVYSYLEGGFPADMVGRLGSIQDQILDEVFSKGYDAVYFADPSSTGASISLVWKDATHIRPVKRLGQEDISSLPYYN